MRILGLLAIGIVAIAVSSAGAADRPNLLFILADDLGWKDLGCYGSELCETPHIDALAQRGMRFTQAYTAGSVCSPTRGSLMTGRYPVRTGVTDYIPGLRPEGRRLKVEPTRTELALEELTIGEALQEAGYQTFYAGKWHLGGAGFEPSEQGFEIYVGDSELGRHNRDWQVGRRISESAVAFLDERDQSRPFFMYLSYHEPHIPILEYPDHIEHFREKVAGLPAPSGPRVITERDGRTRIVQDDAAYGSEVAGLDSFVGMVVDRLDALGVADETIVVFFSDNGGLSTKAQPGPTSNQPLRAGKGWLYEGGIRVPLIIRWPGVTEEPLVCDVPVISTDMFPTLLEMAGAPLRPERHVDGVSIAGLLRGEPLGSERDLFWHFPHYHGSTWAPGSAVRDGDWKLIEFFEEETVELYNLAEDLGEQHDLATAQPEVARRLQAKLDEWRRATDAQIPVAVSK